MTSRKNRYDDGENIQLSLMAKDLASLIKNTEILTRRVERIERVFDRFSDIEATPKDLKKLRDAWGFEA